jgi:hypothetical protein
MLSSDDLLVVPFDMWLWSWLCCGVVALPFVTEKGHTTRAIFLKSSWTPGLRPFPIQTMVTGDPRPPDERVAVPKTSR